MKVQYPIDEKNPWWWTHYQEAIWEMLILKDQKSLDAIEGKTNITYKTEIQKDSPCKELTLDMQSKDSVCKDLTYEDSSKLSWLKKWKPMSYTDLVSDTKLGLRLGVWHKCLESDWLEMLQGLTLLYLLQGGIWTKWEMNMVMNMNMVHFDTQLQIWNSRKA